MKKILLAATILLAGIISCKKPVDDIKPLTPEALLKSKTWVYDELTEYETGFPPEVLYKKGGAANLLDLSKVEQKFADNSVWQYVDPNGAVGSGSWKLLENNTKIEFRIPATSSPEIGQEFKITASTMSYKTVEATGYSIHKLIPKP